MGFVLTSTPAKAVRTFCKARRITARQNIDLATCLDLKASGSLFHYDDTISLEADLAEVVYVARRLQADTGCESVAFAWPEGAGVFVGGRTLITTLPSEGYGRMSWVEARDALVEDGLTQEEAEAQIEEDGSGYDGEVDHRDWLQASWQDAAIRAGRYPSKQQLARKPPFSILFGLGFDIQHYTPQEIASLDQQIEQMQGRGPSYTDLDKARAFLEPIPGEHWRAHRGRINVFFDNAPKAFLDTVRNFEALIPVSASWVVQHGSARVRGSVKIGRIAARSINGFGDGYEYLVEPARSDTQVLCTVLSNDADHLSQVPEAIQRDLETFRKLLPVNPKGAKGTNGAKGAAKTGLVLKAAPQALAIERLDEAIAWCVGLLRKRELAPQDLVALHELLRGRPRKPAGR